MAQATTTVKVALLIALAVLAAGYLALAARALRRAATRDVRPLRPPSPHHLLVGFVTNFFDALGIGNFAPTTAWFRAARMVRDERLPGTLNAGHTLPVMLMGVLFIDRVAVAPTTLLAMIAAAVAGAFWGAGVVARLPRRPVQVGLGLALLLAAAFMAGFAWLGPPTGDDALALHGTDLVLGCLGIGVLGALMTIGVGLYAPCMVLVALLGMDPIAAFPIMMGACAFLMPFASARFLLSDACALRPAMGLALGGIPGVLLAVYVVRSLPLDALRWLVVAVVTVTALAMLRGAGTPPRTPRGR